MELISTCSGPAAYRGRVTSLKYRRARDCPKFSWVIKGSTACLADWRGSNRVSETSIKQTIDNV